MLPVMMYQGLVVIDQDDREIKLFPGIPDVLSSAIQGWEVEYYKRQHQQLMFTDLVGKQEETILL